MIILERVLMIWGVEKDFWDTGNILFFYLDGNYTCVLPLQKFTDLCPYDLCAFLYMYKDIYENSVCMLTIMLCNKLFQNSSLGHIYDPTVSLGRECRHGFRGSSGSPWVSHKASHFKAQPGGICILACSCGWWQDSVLCRSLAGEFPSSWATCQRPPSFFTL